MAFRKKTYLHSHFPFTSPYLTVLCIYPVRLEQLIYFHVKIRPLKEKKMGQGAGERLEVGEG